MRKSEAIAFFGSQAALARALGIEPPSVAGWGEDSIPALRQLQIEKLTDGKLKAVSGILPAPAARQQAASARHAGRRQMRG